MRCLGILLVFVGVVSCQKPSWHPGRRHDRLMWPQTVLGCDPKAIPTKRFGELFELPDIEEVVDIVSKHKKRNKLGTFNVIQVGAHVGFTENDPVHKIAIRDKWQGVLMEPVPELFKQLKENYKNSKSSRKLKLENSALSDKTGTATFNMRAQAGDFEAAGDMSRQGIRTQMGSLRKDYGERGTQIKVKTITWADLLKKHKIKKVDYLQIDAEGMDAVVLSQVNFTHIAPTLIAFESKHLEQNESKFSVKKLLDQGYLVHLGGPPDFDVTGLKRTWCARGVPGPPATTLGWRYTSTGGGSALAPKGFRVQGGKKRP